MADGVQLSVKQFKAGFFDKEAIKLRLDATNRRVQSTQGSYIRRQMKGLVRYGKKPSIAGDPPHAHRSEHYKRTKTNKAGVAKTQAASPLRELIFFAYDAKTDSTVVGPAKFGAGLAPHTLEKGGPMAIIEPLPLPAKRAISERQKASYRRLLQEGRLIAPERQFAVRTFRVKPRPFVKRAGDEVMTSDKMKNLLRG